MKINKKGERRGKKKAQERPKRERETEPTTKKKKRKKKRKTRRRHRAYMIRNHGNRKKEKKWDLEIFGPDDSNPGLSADS